LNSASQVARGSAGQWLGINKGRVCAPGPAARLRSQGAGRCVCDLDPRSSLAPGGQIEPLRLAFGIRRGGSYLGSLAPRDARGRSSSAPTHGLGGWRVGYGLLARLLAATQTRAEDDQARTSHCAKQGGVVRFTLTLAGDRLVARLGWAKMISNLRTHILSRKMSPFFYSIQTISCCLISIWNVPPLQHFYQCCIYINVYILLIFIAVLSSLLVYNLNIKPDNL
jgi:hypothetical protein